MNFIHVLLGKQQCTVTVISCFYSHKIPPNVFMTSHYMDD